MPGGRIWNRGEYIRVLALYLEAGRRQLPATSIKVMKLSKSLGRTPDAINMRMGNFLWVDPARPGGLSGGHKRCKEIWDEFADEPAKLRRAAAAIKVRKKGERGPVSARAGGR